ncbi:unnamed protein product [Cuscuta epithymum]|uniref:Leucine-rich repeat-containing N-terminal plant-type domain-containing protein n=1 Tax=Cuscuta epithymum TaxID=186058 RepID=A0AAV0CX87_9ASTE|nr:unnamed protein product [Cuscuta epithymum]
MGGDVGYYGGGDASTSSRQSLSEDERRTFGGVSKIAELGGCGGHGCAAGGDALSALKKKLDDPTNVLQSWDDTLVNPCTWFHVTCNKEDQVTRIDLGNAGLSGQLVPELGNLSSLQYLELYQNNISGTIPETLGNVRSLVSLDLYLNNLNGNIPETLGNLKNLRFL